MNTILLRLVMVLALGMFGIAGVGCEGGGGDEGPLEEAGQELDQAAQDAGEAIEGAGEEIDQEVGDAGAE